MHLKIKETKLNAKFQISYMNIYNEMVIFNGEILIAESRSRGILIKTHIYWEQITFATPIH